MPTTATTTATTPPTATTTTTTATTPTNGTVVLPPESAVSALAALTTADPASSAGYSRDQFGQKWSDDVAVDGGHNGCDQRSDVLRRDLVDVTIKPDTRGCVPLTGTLHDPYTDETISFVRGATTSDDVQIEHVVALAAAWRSGAQLLTAERRQDLANDPLELLAVGAKVNQDKSDQDASEWMPPAVGYRCPYVARQIAIKTKYRLWVTSAERVAMTAVLDGCPDQRLPDDAGIAVPPLR